MKKLDKRITTKLLMMAGLISAVNANVTYETAPTSHKFTSTYMDMFRANAGDNIDTSATAPQGYQRVSDGIRITDLIARANLPTNYSSQMYFKLGVTDTAVPKSVLKDAIDLENNASVDTKVTMDTWAEFVAMMKNHKNNGSFKQNNELIDTLGAHSYLKVKVDKDKNLITDVLGINLHNGSSHIAATGLSYESASGSGEHPADVQKIEIPGVGFDPDITLLDFSDPAHSFYSLTKHGKKNPGLYADNAHVITSTTNAMMDKEYRHVAFKIGDTSHGYTPSGLVGDDDKTAYNLSLRFYKSLSDLNDDSAVDSDWFKGLTPRKNSPLMKIGTDYKLSFDKDQTALTSVGTGFEKGFTGYQFGEVDSNDKFNLETDIAKWLAILARGHDKKYGTDQGFVDYTAV